MPLGSIFCLSAKLHQLRALRVLLVLALIPVELPHADISILYHDDAIAIVQKPSCLLSVPGRGEHKQDCVIARVRARFPNASGPMMVHRLDFETSGLIVVALTPDAQRHLSRQFEFREVDKAYVALLDGVLPHDTGEVRMKIRVDWDNRPRQMVCEEHGRDSLTRYRVLAREPLAPAAPTPSPVRTRVEFTPITGRSHQLRVHAAFPQSLGGLAMPILGDPLYGDAHNAPTSPSRLCLHATYLAINHPATNQRLEFRSPEPF